MDMIQYGFLALLHEQEAHGYRLHHVFNEYTGTVWGLNAGQVYQILHRLEAQGLITGRCEQREQAIGRRVFGLTPKGEKTLHARFPRRPCRPKPFRDDLLLHLLISSVCDADSAIKQIEQQKTVYRSHLARLTALREKQKRRPPDAPGRFLAELATVGALERTTAHLKWLDYCACALRAGASATATDGTDEGSLDHCEAAPEMHRAVGAR